MQNKQDENKSNSTQVKGVNSTKTAHWGRTFEPLMKQLYAVSLKIACKSVKKNAQNGNIRTRD